MIPTEKYSTRISGISTVTDDIFEQARLFLPKYLTPAQEKELFSELKKFPDNPRFYLETSTYPKEILQGDGWRGFVVIDFQSTEKRDVSGVVLSNSCDISEENARSAPVNVLFSPMIPVQKYADLLSQHKEPDQVDRVIASIRKQQVTSIFYLPESPGALAESMILLDNIHSHPMADFSGRARSKVFTLNQYAFYLFLMKLSIHFSRFGERVARFDEGASH